MEIMEVPSAREGSGITFYTLLIMIVSIIMEKIN